MPCRDVYSCTPIRQGQHAREVQRQECTAPAPASHHRYRRRRALEQTSAATAPRPSSPVSSPCGPSFRCGARDSSEPQVLARGTLHSSQWLRRLSRRKYLATTPSRAETRPKIRVQSSVPAAAAAAALASASDAERYAPADQAPSKPTEPNQPARNKKQNAVVAPPRPRHALLGSTMPRYAALPRAGPSHPGLFCPDRTVAPGPRTQHAGPKTT